MGKDGVVVWKARRCEMVRKEKKGEWCGRRRQAQLALGYGGTTGNSGIRFRRCPDIRAHALKTASVKYCLCCSYHRSLALIVLASVSLSIIVHSFLVTQQ